MSGMVMLIVLTLLLQAPVGKPRLGKTVPVVPANTGFFTAEDASLGFVQAGRLAIKWTAIEARRCVYIYTYYHDPANYERVALCTVPFQRNPDAGCLSSYCFSADGKTFTLCADKPDPKRILEHPYVECMGRGCE